jgi:DNA-binding transcriptional LysR family regulator
LGRRQIAPLLAEFAAQHPVLEVHLVPSDAGLEVGQDGLDVALRIDRPDDPAVITRKMRPPGASSAPHRRTWRRMACRRDQRILRATNACASRAVTACTIVGGSARRPASRRSRSAVIFPAAVATRSTAGRSKAGGSRRTLCATLADDLEAGRLVECLADYRCGGIELFATFPPGHPLPPRIRLFVDFMVAAHLS